MRMRASVMLCESVEIKNENMQEKTLSRETG